MGLPALAAVGAAAYGAVKGIEYLTTTEHDRALKKAYKVADKYTDSSATIFVDHVTDQPTPHGAVDGLTQVPDMVIRGNPDVPNVIVEVETADSLDRAYADARSQLEDFRTRGYRRLLVVPSDALEAAETLAGAVDGTVTVTTPKGLGAEFQ